MPKGKVKQTSIINQSINLWVVIIFTTNTIISTTTIMSSDCY